MDAAVQRSSASRFRWAQVREVTVAAGNRLVQDNQPLSVFSAELCGIPSNSHGIFDLEARAGSVQQRPKSRKKPLPALVLALLLHGVSCLTG